MDIASRKIELKSEISEEQTQITKTVKRPFDVAFLMLPDEKLKQKQIKRNPVEVEVSYNNSEDEEIEIEDTPRDYKVNKYFTQKQQIFDDPNLIKAKNLENKLLTPTGLDQKSAFTKVNLSKDSRISPGLSISPDLAYQSSLSPSPPQNRTFQNFSLSPGQIFKSHAYQNNFLPDIAHPASSLETQFIMKSPTAAGGGGGDFGKIRPMYRPELAYNYQQFPAHQEVLKIGQPTDIRNPAAAILTSLLPPSLAALSLPAQNVCAKCNITFRMTSDLVYHMRSHHKNETTDMNKRRREEKLKCPVCAESFRERHHLTRHMTAHQDKDDEEKSAKNETV